MMPNHIHGILQIIESKIKIDSVRAGLRPARSGLIECADNDRAGHRPARTGKYALSEIIRGFKSYASRKINILFDSPGAPLWHRNYYDHIIRSPQDLDRIRAYIRDNPNQQ
jgi:REP element-mobilizing transposase RayT